MFPFRAKKKKVMNQKSLATFILLSVAVILAPVMPVRAQSAFFQAVTNLNPAAYWPLQETASPPAADVEANLGSLGTAGNAYYSSTNVVKGISGAISGDSDPAAGFQSGLNGGYPAVPPLRPTTGCSEHWATPTTPSPRIISPECRSVRAERWQEIAIARSRLARQVGPTTPLCPARHRP